MQVHSFQKEPFGAVASGLCGLEGCGPACALNEWHIFHSIEWRDRFLSNKEHLSVLGTH